MFLAIGEDSAIMRLLPYPMLGFIALVIRGSTGVDFMDEITLNFVGIGGTVAFEGNDQSSLRCPQERRERHLRWLE